MGIFWLLVIMEWIPGMSGTGVSRAMIQPRDLSFHGTQDLRVARGKRFGAPRKAVDEIAPCPSGEMTGDLHLERARIPLVDPGLAAGAQGGLGHEGQAFVVADPHVDLLDLRLGDDGVRLIEAEGLQDDALRGILQCRVPRHHGLQGGRNVAVEGLGRVMEQKGHRVLEVGHLARLDGPLRHEAGVFGHGVELRPRLDLASVTTGPRHTPGEIIEVDGPRMRMLDRPHSAARGGKPGAPLRHRQGARVRVSVDLASGHARHPSTMRAAGEK
ncbi:MAG: hypothetical protein CMO01_00185 [Thalassobius sp.]|nr:hypothetical protein [Thalassovita sp.]